MLYYHRNSCIQEQERQIAAMQKPVFKTKWSPVLSSEQYHRRQQLLAKNHLRQQAYNQMREWWRATIRVQAINRKETIQ